MVYRSESVSLHTTLFDVLLLVFYAYIEPCKVSLKIGFRTFTRNHFELLKTLNGLKLNPSSILRFRVLLDQTILKIKICSF